MDKNIDQIQNDAEKAAEEKIKQDAISNVNKKMVIVDTEQMAEDEARKAADAYMTEDKAKSNVFKRFWKHTFLEGFYRQRQVDKVKEEIKNSGNMYVGRLGNDKTAHNNTMQAISERFISDYDGLIKDGEEKEVLNDTDPKTVEARNGIKSLITLYAQNNIQEEAFTEEKNRIFNNLNDKKARNSLNSYADNLLEIAKNARVAIEHGAKMDELDLDTNIILGKAKSSLSTEAHYNNVDKAVAWTKSSKIGKFLSPALVSTGIGLAYSLSVGLGTKLLRTKAAQYGTFGAAVVISSALAGMNESQRLAAERAQHGLEMAEGGVIGPDSERRDKMEEFQYAMESSKVLEERLRSLMFEKDKDGNDVPKNIVQADLDQILASLAEIDARHSLNEKNKIDLISYTNIANVEKESKDLAIFTAMAKVELRKKIVAGLVNIPQGKTFNSYLKEKTNALEMSLLGGQKGINAQDKSFGKFRTKEVIKKVLKNVAIGLTVGAVVQEGWAFFKDDTQGFTEGFFHQDAHATSQTPLENLSGWITGHPSHMGLGNPFESTLDGHNFKLPEGASILQNPDQTYNIFRGDQLVSDHIPLTFDNVGNIDQESMARLGEEGIVAHTTCTEIDSTKEVITHAKDWVHANLDKMTHISRSWMGNDTPMYPDPDHPGHLLGADLNELRTQWAGLNGTGFDEHGDVVMSVQHMTNDGSFQDGISVAARDDMMQGKLEVLLSVTKDTQTHVIKGLIGPDGLIHFSHDDANTQMLFESVKGHAQYDGAFIEIAKHSGDLPDGREAMQILSTHIGTDHVKDIIERIPDCVEVPTTNLDIPLRPDPPMFIPIWGRKPLEPIKYNENLYYGGAIDIEAWQKDFSPRLRNNPDAKLDSQEEIAWYFEDQKRRYPGYVEKELASLDAQNPEPLGNKVEAIVCVAAAGHQEHNNIYKSLETYSLQQDNKGKSVWKGINENKFEIFLYINWPKGQSPQKTLDEIERFKKDHPQVKLRVYKEEIEGGKVELGWLKKKIFDLALKKHGDRNSKNDIAIITNDADMTFISPHYLENAIGSLNSKKNQNIDAILGRHDLDPGTYKKNPTFHTAMRFWQMMETVMRSKYGLIGSQGRNTIMRGSSYAAVGGNHIKEFWGDIEFGLKFGIARGRSAMAYSNDVWVTVDPRREIDKFKSGEKIAHTWSSDFNTRNVRGSSKSEYAVPENLDISKLAGLEENDPEVVAFKLRLQDELQEICNLFDRITPGYISMPNNSGFEKEIRPEIKMLAKRALGFLGIKADIVDYSEDGHMKFQLNLTDTKKLREGLKNYNENHGDKVKMPK